MNVTSSAPLIPLDTSSISNRSKPSKLHDAAQQFEALMIGELMKSVRESGSEGWLGSEGDSGSESAMDMAEGQFAKALSLSGGLGLTKMIEQNVGAERNKLQNAAAAPNNFSVPTHT
jgi:Rod binding domain-containing protein